MFIIFFGIILRVTFAYINSFYGPFPGLEFDAIKFHEVAVLVSEDSSNMDFRTGWLYSTVLGLLKEASKSVTIDQRESVRKAPTDLISRFGE